MPTLALRKDPNNSSTGYGEIDIAVRMPLNQQRLTSVGDRLFAHIPSRSVVDLLTGIAQDPEHEDDATPRRDAPTHQPDALEVEHGSLARSQQVAMLQVADVARPCPEGGQQDVVAAGGPFIQLNVEIEILLVGGAV